MYHLDEIRPQYKLGGDDPKKKKKKNQSPYIQAEPEIPKYKLDYIRSVESYAKRGEQALKPIVYGNREDYNRRVRQIYPEINSTVDSIANAYGENPALIDNRLLYEGFIDNVAINHDNAVRILRERPSDIRYLRRPIYSESNYEDLRSGFGYYGTDDAAIYINSGEVQLINEPWSEETAVNENGRVVHGVNTDWKSNIGILAAHIKMFREQAKRDFPNLSEDKYDELALAYFNRGRAGGKKYYLSGAKDKRYSLKNVR